MSLYYSEKNDFCQTLDEILSSNRCSGVPLFASLQNAPHFATLCAPAPRRKFFGR